MVLLLVDGRGRQRRSGVRAAIGGRWSQARGGGRLSQPRARLSSASEPSDADAMAWITSHSFRKTNATILDDAGLTARQIADQLGHARPSLTMDVYMGRGAGGGAAAAALEEALTTDARPKVGGFVDSRRARPKGPGS